MNFRRGRLALTVEFYPHPHRRWTIRKWEYKGQSSWRHGTAYLWRFKLIW